jgi:hypothetical protein
MTELTVLFLICVVCFMAATVILVFAIRNRLCSRCGFWYTHFLGHGIDGTAIRRCTRCGHVTEFYKYEED